MFSHQNIVQRQFNLQSLLLLSQLRCVEVTTSIKLKCKLHSWLSPPVKFTSTLQSKAMIASYAPSSKQTLYLIISQW